MWVVYVVRCADDSLYCGITNDLPARLAAHDAGKGAKYTRGRGPLALVATQKCRDKRVALRIEHAVKRLRRPEKLALDAARLREIAVVARRRLRAATVSARLAARY
jgi:predicted GIY-YIG superfamily endonuclease